MWRRVVDEHNFAVDQQLSDEVRCRLQVLRCVHDDAVLLAVQNTGEGPSVINRAEDVAHTAQQRFLSGDGDGPPPDLVIRMHDARDDHMPWHCYRFAVDDAGRVQGSPTSSKPWRAIIDACADEDRGAGFAPRPAKHWPWRDAWRFVPVTEPTDVAPFRAPDCMGAGRGLRRRTRLLLRGGVDDCCPYHRVNWAPVTAAVETALSHAADSNEPDTGHTARISL